MLLPTASATLSRCSCGFSALRKFDRFLSVLLSLFPFPVRFPTIPVVTRITTSYIL